MACLKCGSEWATRWGKDKLSCPECCKQQRAKARRLGHLSATETKQCEKCGEKFEASGGNAIARAKYCGACRIAKGSSRDRRQRYERRVKDGVVVPRPRAERYSKKGRCLRCDARLRKSQEKYCSKACFFANRNDGVQEWDRTAQTEALLKRCGVSTTPSRIGLRAVLNAFPGFMTKLRLLYKSVCKPDCPVCGLNVDRAASRFCSDECSRKFEFSTCCRRCGCAITARGHRGSRLRTCEKCKEKIAKEGIRRHRQKYGKNHRDRARHHGVQYVSFPVREIYERDGYKCQICNKRVFKKARYRKSDGKIHSLSPTIDHIVPMSKGGNHEPDNCQTACFMCNSRKSDSSGGQLRLAIAASPVK